jgi:hypothetical protein
LRFCEVGGGVRRDLLHAAGQAGVPAGDGDPLDGAMVDEAQSRDDLTAAHREAGRPNNGSPWHAGLLTT